MNAAAISIRPAQHTDFAPVAEMLAHFVAQHHPWRPAAYRRKLLGFTAAIFQSWLKQPDSLLIVAEAQSVVTGYASAYRWQNPGSDFEFPRKHVHVGTLVVSAAHRRQGIGQALLAAVERWANDYGAVAIGLNVDGANDEAKAFYEKVGYRLASEARSKPLRQVKHFLGHS